MYDHNARPSQTDRQTDDEHHDNSAMVEQTHGALKINNISFIYFIRLNIQQKRNINTMTYEQDSPGSNER